MIEGRGALDIASAQTIRDPSLIYAFSLSRLLRRLRHPRLRWRPVARLEVSLEDSDIANVSVGSDGTVTVDITTPEGAKSIVVIVPTSARVEFKEDE